MAWKARRNILILPAGMAGDDFAQLQSDCGVSRLIIENGRVGAIGVQPLVVNGVAVALWSAESASEASLVVFHPSTNEYEASRLAIRCDR